MTDERDRDQGERNQPGDVDRESHSLQRFLDLVLAGQPIALEMLFAPDQAMTMPPAPLWREVQALAPRLVSRRATVFLRYGRVQAERYGAKGARAAAARQALAVLEAAEAAHGTTARLGLIEAELTALVADTAHAALIDVDVGGGRIVRHLDLCGRKTPLHASIKWAREMAARLLAEYGDRARGGGGGQAVAGRSGEGGRDICAAGRTRRGGRGGVGAASLSATGAGRGL